MRKTVLSRLNQNKWNFLQQREHELYLKGKRGNDLKKSFCISGRRFLWGRRCKYSRFLNIPF